MARDMMLTIDEYMALRRLISSEKEAEGTDMSFQEKRRQRRTSGYTKELGRQIRKVREKATLKNGTLRKGWDESKIMTEAHKQTRRMRKKD